MDSRKEELLRIKAVIEDETVKLIAKDPARAFQYQVKIWEEKEKFRKKYQALQMVTVSAIIVYTIICLSLSFKLNEAKRGDLDLDGSIGVLDLSILGNNWDK